MVTTKTQLKKWEERIRNMTIDCDNFNNNININNSHNKKSVDGGENENEGCEGDVERGQRRGNETGEERGGDRSRERGKGRGVSMLVYTDSLAERRNAGRNRLTTVDVVLTTFDVCVCVCMWHVCVFGVHIYFVCDI